MCPRQPFEAKEILISAELTPHMYESSYIRLSLMGCQFISRNIQECRYHQFVSMGLKLATAAGSLIILLIFKHRELLFLLQSFFTFLKNKLFFISQGLSFFNRFSILITELVQLSQNIIITEQRANVHTFVWLV